MEKKNPAEFTPVPRWHTDKRYVLDGCQPLPATLNYDKDDGTVTINSVWKMCSIVERVKFLFSGIITLRVWGSGQPPVCIVNGDIFGGKR